MHEFLKFIFGIKLCMFQTVPLSIIRSFSLYTQHWYMSYSLRAGSGGNCSSILILLASCQQTYVTYTIAVCTVKNSWWWTEELSETCRVLVYVIQLAIRIRMVLSSILILLASCQQTCMTYTTAVCTVNNSWWWTEELSETCWVLFQK